MHTHTSDLWTRISNNPGTTAAILSALALSAYGSHTVANAAGDDVQQRAEDLANHLGEVLNTEILPNAEVRMQNVITHTAHELKSVIQSALLGCCWIGITFFGLKLAHDGITDLEKIPDDKSKIKNLHAAKTAIGVVCTALATYAVYTLLHGSNTTV